MMALADFDTALPIRRRGDTLSPMSNDVGFRIAGRLQWRRTLRDSARNR
jgi:hypothetical protein